MHSCVVTAGSDSQRTLCSTAVLKANLVSLVPRLPITRLSPIPLKNVEFRDGMGLRLVIGIPCLSAFRESIGVAITKSFVIFVRKFFVSSL